MDQPQELRELRGYLAEVSDLRNVQALLHWDQATYLPAAAAAGRGRQLATLGKIAHDRLTSVELEKLLDAAELHVVSLPPDHDDAALVRVTRRDYTRATQVPTEFMATATEHFAESYAVWAEARPANDFAAVRPYLEKTLDLSRRYADFFPGYDHIADPLIDESDQGMSVAEIRPLFARLRSELAPMVEAICAQEPVDDSCLHRTFPADLQWQFGEEVIARLGYDFARGRQDKTHHPFMIRLGHDDNRITTRVSENRLDEMLFGTIHECGHALYEMGTDASLAGTPLDKGTSAGVHESQSRLWENIVGRSRPFWSHYYPQLQQVFPEQLGQVPLDAFYRAINKVQRSLIRTDADELTYNLHIIIRFELELDLLEGRLAIAELPEAWHAAYTENLGIRAPSDVNGVLQDVHWYAGFIGGAFQSYTLGNIMASQFYAAAVAAHPAIPAQMADGDFSDLRDWLVTNVCRFGRKYDAADLVERASGSALNVDPYLAYLRTKYDELYQW